MRQWDPNPCISCFRRRSQRQARRDPPLLSPLGPWDGGGAWLGRRVGLAGPTRGRWREAAAQSGGHVGQRPRLELGSGALPASRFGPSGGDSAAGPPRLGMNKSLFFQQVCRALSHSLGALAHPPVSFLWTPLYILDTSPSSNVFFANTFSQMVTYLFILLIVVFTEQKSSFILMKSQIRSVAQSCRTLCDPMNRSRPGLPVHHQLPEFTQTHIHPVSDAIQPSHPLSSPSPPTPTPSQHQSLPMSQLFA